jgi:VIT1/CCC1 family predicted Fe2+/Mn2+ transporter
MSDEYPSVMMSHREFHRTEHIGWLRAAVLGANDGLISTSSLVVGVAAAGSSSSAILVTALAGLVAGALSMAAGEYVSVSSQGDTEEADLAREKRELADQPVAEHQELVQIYVARGLESDLAEQVATQLMAHDALGAHVRDELGMFESTRARPLQAALASAAAFAVGAAPPVLLAATLLPQALPAIVIVSSLILLLVLGGVAARLGRAPLIKGAMRVGFWGALAMAATFLIGHLFGTVV